MPPLNVNPGLVAQVNSPEVQGFQADLMAVLQDLLTASGLTGNPKVLVTCRLNQTSAPKAIPIWCGWVESQSSPNSPSLDKIVGGNHHSPVYQECFDISDKVRQRTYPPDEPREKIPDAAGKPPFKLDSGTLQYTWRRYMCIKDAGGHRIGTLTVGFQQTPSKPADVETRLTHWAQGSGQFHLKVLQKFKPSAI